MWILKRIGKQRTYHDLDLVVLSAISRDLNFSIEKVVTVSNWSIRLEIAPPPPRLLELPLLTLEGKKVENTYV